MKKYLSLILIMAILFSLSSCRKKPDNDSSSGEISVAEETVYVSEPAEQKPQGEPVGSTESETESQPEQDEKDWQSTVIAPITVIFYKDGMQSVSTDKELNLKIAQHIESWYKYETIIAGCNLAATTDLIDSMRRTETAVELQFDGEIKFYGGVWLSNAKTLFLPLTGDYDNMLFNNTINSPDYWGGPNGTNGGTGLEQYFDCVEFMPLSEEERRWRSTINTADSIEFYENGNLIGETGTYASEYRFNREISKHIESWFYHKEDIDTVMVNTQPLELVWENETYIKLWFGGNITFYGEQIVSEKSAYLIIPIAGEYAYHIFESTYEETSNIAYVTNGDGLEQFFESLKSNDNS